MIGENPQSMDDGRRQRPDARETAEIARLGQELYEHRLRSVLEPAHDGEFAVIDVDTGMYEVDPRAAAATHRAVRRSPKGRFYTVRVGASSAFRLGRASGSVS